MKHTHERKTLLLRGGERLAYFEAGQGPGLLLVHGAVVTSHDMLLSLLEPLARTHRVVAVDRPGHGLSTRPRLSGSPRRQAELILEGAGRLGLHRPVVVGHSVGGTVALEMALSWPELIAGAVAAAPIAFPEPRLEQILFGPRAALGFGEWASRVGGVGLDAALLPMLWRAMFLPQRMPEAFRTGMAFDEVRCGPGLLANGEDAVATPAALVAMAARYGGCRVPVELIAGDRDLVVNPLLHSHALSRLLPVCSLSWAPGSGHMLHHFRADLIVEAVRRLASGTG
ncbi:alpha/beta fold hydrolase [Hansschlegelia sp. KR7-227]|uniref:alpha/beta fold hydrolase n=1 Tax=Hansschlegelia sp. KR7-227 TaxID=3400914 RepID=UPI003C10F175